MEDGLGLRGTTCSLECQILDDFVGKFEHWEVWIQRGIRLEKKYWINRWILDAIECTFMAEARPSHNRAMKDIDYSRKHSEIHHHLGRQCYEASVVICKDCLLLFNSNYRELAIVMEI